MVLIKEFRQLIHESTEAIAGILAQEKADGKDLLSPAVRQKKIQHELENNAETLEKKMHEGLKACILSLDQCHDLPMSVDEVLHELQKCIQPIKSVEDFAQLGQSVFLGTSWKSQLGISNACMQTIYQGARAIFKKKDYKQAEKAFFAICSLDPTQFAYWIGLGHSSFQIKNYPQAINAYSMASAIDPENVWPHIWAANSFEEEKDFHHAKMALNAALSLQMSKTPKNDELIQSLEERVQKIQTR